MSVELYIMGLIVWLILVGILLIAVVLSLLNKADKVMNQALAPPTQQIWPSPTPASKPVRRYRSVRYQQLRGQR